MPNPTDSLLRYRPWRGQFFPPWAASAAMARVGLRLMLRRKLFWALYALAALVFFFFFYGQYMVVWIKLQTAEQTVTFAGLPVKAGEVAKFLDILALDGSGKTFASFIWFQGYISMIVLALAGAVLVGNDFHHGSLSFYLSKPLGRRHYVLGKALGAAVFVNLLTTLPAIILYVQAGMLYDWQIYYLDHLRELAGILGYGAVLTVTLSLLLVATAVWLRRTMPLVMVWAGIFVLARGLAAFLVEGRRLDPNWKLIDLWNDLYRVGLWLLDVPPNPKAPPEPATWAAALVVAGVCVACLLYLRRRIEAVEVVS
jgi:ABC-type transport system involved in multi-copper enzyme maturation permease subunit